MWALRPHLEDEAEFVRRVDEVQRPEGYRLVGAFEDGRCVAVAGFREVNSLADGHAVYVDDLSTHPDARRRGHGRALVDWCADEARRLGCEQLQLDSAVEATRLDAHRLYLNAGMRITAFHFEKIIGAQPAEPAASAKRTGAQPAEPAPSAKRTGAQPAEPAASAKRRG